ncbi:MAG: hypothetical protein ACR2QG_02280 [Gammaproteobacteria bacterium]
MIHSIVEIGVEIDFGSNVSGAILQRRESDVWYDYLVDGALVVNPFDVEKLPPGYYRLVESTVSSH